MHGATYRTLRQTDAVHVWQGRVPDSFDPAALAVLSPGERETAARRPAPVGTRYARVHAEVRRILAGYLDADPGELRVGRWPCPRCPDPAHGRPRLEFPRTGLDFNLSHSGAHWLLAVTAERPVGVDLENARPAADLWTTSAAVMSPSELRHLRGLPDEAARTAAYYRAWTRKEAVVKASGVGVVADLRAVEVRPHEPAPVLVRHAEPRGPQLWLVRDLPLGPGRYGALATEPELRGPVLLIDPAGPGTAVVPVRDGEAPLQGPLPDGVPSHRLPLPDGEPPHRLPLPDVEPSHRLPLPDGVPSHRLPLPDGVPSHRMPLPDGEPPLHAPVPDGVPPFQVSVPEGEPPRR
ncbi:4'-phosphopantetheinyl transferase superfamily protein [Streptomyces griseosporeus]